MAKKEGIEVTPEMIEAAALELFASGITERYYPISHARADAESILRAALSGVLPESKQVVRKGEESAADLD